MTTQTVYVHMNGSRSVRCKGTTTDGAEASVSTDQVPALSIGDWAGSGGVVITHAIATADTFARYAYIRSRDGVTKGVIPVATTGRSNLYRRCSGRLKRSGDLLRVMTDA